MMKRFQLRVASLALLYAISGQNALADSCVTSGTAGARELALDLKDEKTQHALEHALLIGFSGDAFSDAKLRALSSPCLRAAAPLDGETLEIRGENTDRPMRWARTERADAQIIFVAKAPRPDAAMKKLEKGPLIGTDLLGRFRDDELMYVVAITGKPGERLVTHFFDELPDDEKLQSVVGDIVANRVSVKVGFGVGMQEFKPQSPASKN